MRTSLKYLFIISVSSAMFSGCCMMRNGPTQVVEITSTPTGATAHIQPGNTEIVTPSEVSLKRKTSYYVVTLNKAGYEPTRVRLARTTSGLWRNLVWIHPVGWVIGIVVDTSTGSAAYELQPQKIDVKMAPLQETTSSQKREPTDGPPR